MPALPEPEDAFDERLLGDVRAYGWHCVLVADGVHPEHAAEGAGLPRDDAYEATFAYTTGLWRTHGHPELVLVGGWQHAHAVLAAVVALIEAGARFAAGEESTEVLEGYPIRFGAVAEARREALLTYASWLNRREPFEALQVVVPDRDGRWPGEPGYHAYPQPLLA